eukprot:scaffold52184_cov37-Prasinocladus_malaysianus.AAC.2
MANGMNPLGDVIRDDQYDQTLVHRLGTTMQCQASNTRNDISAFSRCRRHEIQSSLMFIPSLLVV